MWHIRNSYPVNILDYNVNFCVKSGCLFLSEAQINPELHMPSSNEFIGKIIVRLFQGWF